FKYVGVIEFDVVDDGYFREVMNELAALVEEGGVIFVAFDDEPVAFGEAGALAEVVGDATDEVARIVAIVFENPGEQGCGGGLAVRAGDDERTFAANEIFLEQ